MHIWDDLLTEADHAVIEKGNYGQTRGFGENPLLMVIDLQPNYIGADKPVAEQLDEYPSGGGETAWKAMRNALSLRDEARACGIPIFYTRNVQNSTTQFDSFATKTKRDYTKYVDGSPTADLAACVQPLSSELIIPKGYASAFYGTPLQSYLVKLKIDTLIIVGNSTGGCCRATAVDAVTRNYSLGYVEDCLSDRIEVCHKVALLDVWMKYGDVVHSDYVKEYFRKIKKNRDSRS